MATDPTTQGPKPNPARDAGPFGIIEIGGVPVPGIIQSIAGIDVEQEWNFQKAGGGGPAANEANPDPQNGPAAKATVNSAGSFAVSVWRGAKLAEEIAIESVVSSSDARIFAERYDAAIDFIKVVMPKRGRKPPSLTLVNPSANAVGINRCAVRKIGPPTEDKPGSGRWVFKFTVCEYNPQKTAPAGQADPAKPPAEPTPADAQEQELKDLLDKARN
jgi:hypothetical protein